MYSVVLVTCWPTDTVFSQVVASNTHGQLSDQLLSPLCTIYHLHTRWYHCTNVSGKFSRHLEIGIAVECVKQIIGSVN